jgi:hypothetical protein
MPAEVLAGGFVEQIRFDDAGASRDAFAFPPSTPASAVLPTLGATTLFSYVTPSGTLVQSEMMTSDCPHWCPQGVAQMRRVSEFGSIQATVDASSYGDTVFVDPGTYHESVVLRSGIRLVGASPWHTILEGDGQRKNLIDFTGAHDVTIRGLWLRNTKNGTGCGQPDNVLSCSGDWYRAAIFALGNVPRPDGDPCHPVSAHITQNVISDNDIGILVASLPRVVVRNNLFTRNRHGLALNSLHESGVVVNNTFYDHALDAVLAGAAFLHFHENIVSGAGTGFAQINSQKGDATCNLFQAAPVGSGAVLLGVAGNAEGDPLFDDPDAMSFELLPGSPAIDAGCFGPSALDVDGSPSDIGATGGLLGDW